MQFKYKATTASGETIEAVKEAPDRFTFYRQIKKEGQTIVSFQEVSSGILPTLSASLRAKSDHSGHSSSPACHRKKAARDANGF